MANKKNVTMGLGAALAGLALALPGQPPTGGVKGLVGFAPTRLQLDVKLQKVTDLLHQIKNLTGNTVPLGPRVNDIVLTHFKAEGTFWEVTDALCARSGNVLRWRDRQG